MRCPGHKGLLLHNVGELDGEVELADEGTFDIAEVAAAGKWVSTEGPE